jgi:hypothetical protein
VSARKRSWTRALGCGLLAALLAAVSMVPTLRGAGWSLSALPHVDSQTTLGAAARALDHGFHTVHPGAYDGQFYWGMAIDPLASGTLHADFDKPSYRYGHPLYGWVGWLVSGDRASWTPAALAAIGIASMFAGAAVATCLGLGRGGQGWEGLFVALNPGLLGAAALDLAEPLAAAILLAALAAYRRGSLAIAWVCLALLPLAKEPLLLVVLAVVAWELRRRRLRRAALLAASAAPALAWWTYSRVHLGAWFTSGDTALAEPLSGWRGALLGPAAAGHESAFRHAAAVVGLAFLLALLVLAALRALRFRGPVDLAYLGLALVAASLAPNATAEFSTALRNTAFLVILFPFVAVGRPLQPAMSPPARDPGLARPMGAPRGPA